MSLNTAPTFTVGDGTVQTDFGGDDRGGGVVVQSDGKVIVAGFSGSRFIVSRFNADGSSDPNFGVGGVVEQEVGRGAFCTVRLQPDGKILLAGPTYSSALGISYATLVRYNPDGSLDELFGSSGILNAQYNRGPALLPFDVAIQSDGRIVVSTGEAFNGSSNRDFSLMRVNNNGTLDSSFGTLGLVVTPVGSKNDEALGVAVQADGKIVAVGRSTTTLFDQMSVVRYNANGSLDTSFGSGGKVFKDFVPAHAAARDVAVLPDGKILVAGDAAGFFLAKFNTNGTLDSTFGSGGIVYTVNASGSFVGQMLVLPGGKIILAGSYGSSANSDIVVARYNANGTLDAGFGNAGIARYSVPAAQYSTSVSVDGLGRLVITGYTGEAFNADFLTIRLTADGQLDPTFDALPTLGGSVVWVENTAAIVLDSSVQIYDAELAASGNYGGATLTLVRNGGANPEDVFGASGALSPMAQGGALVVSGTTIGTVTQNSDGTLLLTFNAAATQSLVNAALSAITYANTSDAPPASVTIDWTFSDGNTGAQGTGGPLSATGSTTVTITATNDDPAGAPTANLAAGSEDVAYVVTAADLLEGFSDADGDTLSVANLSSSSGTVTDNGNGSYTISAPANVHGLVTLTYEITDGNGGSLTGQTRTFSRAPVNDSPTGIPTATLSDGTEDVAYVVTAADLLLGFSDVDADTLSVANLSSSSGTVTDNGNGSYTISAPANVHGLVTLTYEITDGNGGSLTGQTRTFSRAPVNDSPTGIPTATLSDGTEDVAYVVTAADLLLGFSDVDADTLSIANLSSSSGTVTDNGNGSYTISAPENVHGLVTLTYEVTDGNGGSLTGQTRTFSRAPVNDSPSDIILSSSSVQEFRANGTVVGNLLAADPDAGEIYTFQLLNSAGGRFSIEGDQLRVANGLLLDREQAASHSVSIRVTDSGGLSFTKNFTIAVSDVNPERVTGNSLANTLKGGAGADTFNGGAGNDRLFGQGGNDTLLGGSGNDTLTGGAGRDILTGSAGADDFDFNSIAETGKTASTRDIIKDFVHGLDDIDLSTIDANGGASGTTAFKFLSAKSAAFSGFKGELRWYQINSSNNALDKTIIEGDVNGDKRADFQIELTGLKTLTSADFVL